MGDHISDLNKMIREWLWDHGLLAPYSTCRREDLKFNIKLDGLTCDFDDVKFSDNKKGKPITSTLMTSRYNNQTDEPQEVTISAKRTTTASATGRIKHGFTADHDVGLKVRMPKQVSSTFDGSMEVNSEEVSKMEHTMTWCVQSKITAAPRRTTTARFEVNEDTSTSEFSTYALLKGTVVIDVEDKTAKLKPTVIKRDIKEILDEYLPEAGPNYPRKNLITFERVPRLPADPRRNVIHMQKFRVRWPFRGALDFRYGISQDEVVF